MATSPYKDTVFILEFIHNLNPRTILDVGAGFGRWGFLCRCHFGGGISLTVNAPQPLRIDAVEAFARNVNPVYEAVYNRTFVGDARDIVPKAGEYDVVICSHMVEHLDKEDGRRLMAEMRRHARMALILAFPFNDPLRGPIEGNEFESHRSTWVREDFRDSDALVRGFPFLGGVQAGVVIYPQDANARWHVKTLRNPLRVWAVKKLPKLMIAARRLMGARRARTEGEAT